MKIKLLFTITLLLNVLIVSTIFGQTSKLPSGIGFHIKTPTKEALFKKIELLNSVDYNQLDSFDKWTYNLSKSSVLLYGNQDSSVYYFEMAHQLDTRRNCKVMQMLQISSQQNNEQWFLTELPNFDEEKFIANCQEKIQVLGKDDRVKTNLEKLIMINDQEERAKGSIDWLRQNELDLLNRNLLDSLYSQHESFKSFNKYEQDAFSYVLHHSEDCDWTIKWLEIWLVEIDKGNVVGGIVLDPAFKRMITGSNSFCMKNSKYRTDKFLKMINSKYSEYNYFWKEK